MRILMRFLSGSVLLLYFCTINLYGQEIITGLNGNPVAKAYYNESSAFKKDITADTLELPFIDDFSSSFVEPDTRLWSDNHAFINSRYPISPPTIGVATLDALDFDGSHYPNASVFPYEADRMTSKPINLAYSPSDSIWLSFFYQPQGLGEMPDTQDSLCLDFHSPENMGWETIWAIQGQALKPFELVMINISEERFLKKGFRFRFRNYASLPDNNYADMRSNVDHWHIDYVYLNRNRAYSDTVLRDVAFTQPLKSILKDYESIPWTHFQQAYFTQLNPTIDVTYFNHDTITRNVTRVLEITDMFSGNVYNTTPTANDINSGEKVLYKYPFVYPFNFSAGDSAAFGLLTILRTDAFDYKPNDTLRYIQKFYNYYALDDGTPEAGYGLRGEGMQNASFALKFNTFRPDSLRAIDIYFNQVPDSSNLSYNFFLSVWDNNKGKPGILRYSQPNTRPAYSGSLTDFHRYYLSSPIAVKDTFYIGWTQTVDRFLNVGLDMNKVNNNRMLYSKGGIWYASEAPGTVMIRPIVSMTDLVLSSQNIFSPTLFNIYPNPASSYLYIELKSNSSYFDYYISIIDVYGRLLLLERWSEHSPLNVEGLKNGLYFVKIENSQRKVLSVQKLVIRK